MMKKAIKWIVILLVLGLIGLGLYAYFNPKKALNIIVPDLNQIENIHVTLLQDTAKIHIQLRIQNKGIFKLHIDSLVYHIRLDTATLLSKDEFLDLELQRGQMDTLTLPLSLPYKRMIRKIKSLQGQDSVDVPIELRVVYNTFFGKTVVPFSKTLRIEVPHPPKIEIEKIEFLKREKKTGYFMAHVKIHNYGKINLNISDIKYHMVVEDLFKAEGTEKKEIRIRPRSTINVDLPVKVEFKKILKTVGRILRNDDMVNYRLKVTALIQNDKVSEEKTPIEIEKTGRMELKK